MATVFYSWQSDTSSTTGKNLVHRALEDALTMLASEAGVEDAQRDDLQVDRDTKDVPGSPPIVDTIFGKIDKATAFVADLTFVGMRMDAKRPMPNPNVLIEYGWALRALTHSRVIAVMNVYHGEPSAESLPFDIRHVRWPMTYSCADDADEETRKIVRRRLAKELRDALRPILAIPGTTVPPEPEFIPIEAADGPARFRKAGDPLGAVWSELPIAIDGAQHISLRPGPAMWLRLRPRKRQATTLKSRKILDALKTAVHGVAIAPLNLQVAPLLASLRGNDGCGRFVAVNSDTTPGVFYCFESGEIWTIDAFSLSYEPSVAPFSEENFVIAIRHAAQVLQSLSVDGPYNWSAGMDGIGGRVLGIMDGTARLVVPRFVKNTVQADGEFSGESEAAEAALAPFFDAVFDAAGLGR